MANPIATKLATHAQATADARKPEDVPAEKIAAPGESTIATGAVAAGMAMANAGNAQGRAAIDMRAPGYYSIHIGIIHLKGKSLEWPLSDPLILEKHKDEPYYEELKDYLAHQVRRGYATLVEAQSEEE